jgi:hypothetical protein
VTGWPEAGRRVVGVLDGSGVVGVGVGVVDGDAPTGVDGVGVGAGLVRRGCGVDLVGVGLGERDGVAVLLGVGVLLWVGVTWCVGVVLLSGCWLAISAVVGRIQK